MWVIAILILNLPLCNANPNAIFKHFETLKSHQMLVREKRTASGINLGAVTASFNAFQRRFTLFLTPGMRVIHPGLTAELVNDAGTTRPYNIHSSKFYSGTVEGDVKREVAASQSDGVWMVHIHTPQEFYAVEPLHFYDGKASHQDMIVYRAKDIKLYNRTDRQPLCEEFSFKIPPENAEDRQTGNHHTSRMPDMLHHIWSIIQTPSTESTIDTYKSQQQQQQHRASIKSPKQIVRDKRTSWRHQVYGSKATDCDILAVTDYNLFKGIGGSNPAAIVQTLVHVYNLVDRVFRKTVFGEGFSDGYGIVLRGVMIHTSFSDSMGHYNSDNTSMTAFDVLEAMTGHVAFTDYCLAHLTMQRDMGGILGLAAVAFPEDFWSNGVCAGAEESDARNVGVSTVIDPEGRIMPIKRYSIVLAHEIGHSWGARHDPSDDSSWSCHPDSHAGGKFIMWPYSSLGKDPNSFKFSPCSIEDIRRILKTRAHRCFLPAHLGHEFCGNGLQGQAEECDPGFAFLDKDPCCASNCRLRDGAQCSFRNAPCCTESCQIAPATYRCYPKGKLQPCYTASHCLGHDAMQCPPPTPLPNGAPCGQNGSCRYGRCMSFCEKTGLAKHPTRDFRPCECDSNATSMCRHCCLDKGTLDSTCQVMGGSLKDGTVCLRGNCIHGTCVEREELIPELLGPTGNHRFLMSSLRDSAVVTTISPWHDLEALLYRVIVLVLINKLSFS